MFYSSAPAFRRTRFLNLFFISVLAFSACYSSKPQQQQSGDRLVLPTPPEQPFQIPSPDINLAKPLEISTRQEDVALCEKINQRIEQSEFANARWGVIAISLKDGRVACGRDAQKLFNPASIQKTLTAIVALDTLGASYRWKTSIYGQNQIAPDGTLNGDLILYGQGAPDFDAAGLEKLVADLQAKGLKRVRGSIIGDDSFFKGSAIGDGWTWNELQWHYGAEASALSFNENQAFITIENGVPRAQTDYMQVSGGSQPPENAENGKEKSKSAGVSRGLEDNNFYVWGENQNWGARVAVHKPAGWAARALKEALEKRGIAVEGETKSADWKSETKLDAARAVELAALESQSLGEIVHKMNKSSNNLYAELILRTIGKHFGDTAPDERLNFQEVRGDDQAGASVMKKWLREHNIATEEIQIHDGSGLSRLDFVSPEAFARALIFAARMKEAETFKNSLPIAATDGTLGGRLAKAKGRVFAKTGSVTFVNSLAGYAQRSEDEIFAFAVICNNQTRKANGVGTIDAITMILAGDETADTGNENVNAGNTQNGNMKSQTNADKNR